MDEFGKAINGLEQVATAASLGQRRWAVRCRRGAGAAARSGQGMGWGAAAVGR